MGANLRCGCAFRRRLFGARKSDSCGEFGGKTSCVVERTPKQVSAKKNGGPRGDKLLQSWRSHANGCAQLKDKFYGSDRFFGGSGGMRVFPVRTGAVLAGRKALAAKERNTSGVSGDFFRPNRNAAGTAGRRAAQRF